MQKLLPLAHHAHVFVVEDEDLDRSRYCAAVDISCMFIRIEASPAMSMTSAFGWASCTPMAAGRP